MGKVIILPETPKNPISLIGQRAGICYGSDILDPAKNYQRGLDCIRSGHGRALEFVDIHAILDGYSAKVIREWYTHIGGSPTRLQESTRYKDYSDFKYIIPPSIQKDNLALSTYISAMTVIRSAVQFLENDCKIPKEDASMLLPFAMETKMVDKRNARNIMDMSRQRECSRAFWEYRNNLFHDYKTELQNYSEEWEIFVPLIMYPKCEELGGCPETKSCGRHERL